jgi:outer membrane protein insertion porin family
MWRRVGVGSWIASSFLVASVLVAGAFPVTVTDIRFDGLENIRERDVRDVVTFEIGDEVRESDLKASSQAIHDLGWFREVMPEVGADGAIEFRVSEYPKIEEIEISGNVNRRSYSLFGMELFSLRIMPTSEIRYILRQEDIRKRKVINRVGLENALKEVVAKYNDLGYVLVGIGDVKIDSVLSITILEGRVAGNRIEGLRTVPVAIAEELIDLPLGEPLWQEDIQRVMLALGGSVFFSDVQVVPEPGEAEDEVVLAWTLPERELIDEPMQITRIELEGVSQLLPDEAEGLLGEIPAGPVDNYGLLQAVEDLFDRYQEEGFIMVRFSAEVEDEGVLRLGVEEGEVSQVLLSGNTRTQPHVVLGNLGIEAGDLLTRRALQRAYQRLNSFGYFDSLEVIPEWAENGVRLAVIVTEREDLGGMNGTLAVEPSTGGVVGELTIDQKNLVGSGQDISVSYSRGLGGGIEPMTSTWTLGYSTVAAFPGFDSVGLDLYRSMREVVEEDVTNEYITVGGKATFAYPIGDYTDASISYKHEDERLAGTSDWVPIDTISAGIVYDDVNDPIFPTAGNRQSIQIEKAGGFAAGDEYTKLSVRWMEFAATRSFLFGNRDQATAVRFVAGWADKELRATQSFYLGGPMSVRGTELVRAPRIFSGNFEYRVEVTEGLVLTGFFDAAVNLDSVCIEETLASTGIEFGVNAAGLFVRVDMIWVLDENLSWMPVFDIGFGSMF